MNISSCVFTPDSSIQTFKKIANRSINDDCTPFLSYDIVHIILSYIQQPENWFKYQNLLENDLDWIYRCAYRKIKFTSCLNTDNTPEIQKFPNLTLKNICSGTTFFFARNYEEYTTSTLLFCFEDEEDDFKRTIDIVGKYDKTSRNIDYHDNDDTEFTDSENYEDDFYYHLTIHITYTDYHGLNIYIYINVSKSLESLINELKKSQYFITMWE